MNNKVFNYLKKKGLSDPFEVNNLFVSTFVQEKGWSVQKCSVIKGLLKYEKNTVEEFSKVLKEDGFVFCLEDLIKLFEFVISPSDRIVTGAVYTPANVRDRIIRECVKQRSNIQDVRVADISCGCGGFLMDMAVWIHQKTGKPYLEIFKENLFGIDLQEYAIERARILLCLLALSEGEDANFEFNLLSRDTLDFECGDWNAHYTGFDIIVGNPPYVCSRNLSEETHDKLQNYDVCSSGHPDLYIPFFKIAIDMLNNDGRLGYITMNTFLRSVNGRAIRNFFSRSRYAISIVDFRGYQIFESKNTYTCLFFLDKQLYSESINYAVDDRGTLSDDIKYSSIPYASLDDSKGWTLNQFKSTLAIEAIGIQIKDYCPSRHGIATLSNDTYIFMPVEEDNNYYYLVSGNKRYPIEKGICNNIVNPNKLNSIDAFDLLIEKVIFPYRIENGHAYIYEQAEMVCCFPKAYEYLNANKEILLKRDKGDISAYPQWYAFGRTQSLVLPKYKLFFPKFANRPLRCVIFDDPELLLYNGLAFVNTDERKLRILKAIIESELFWNYLQANGKPYASGYYSLSGVDIKHFGIPKMTVGEEDELLSMNDKKKIEKWLRKRYGISD